MGRNKGNVKPLKEKACIVCGKLFSPKRRSEKYCCNECRKTAIQIREENHPEVKNEKQAKSSKSNNTNIIDINQKARDMNMSYGQYMAKKYMESMKGVLNE